MRTYKEEFSVWPLMIDMLTSILIIFILFNFFDNLLNPQELEQVLIDIKRDVFVQQFDEEFSDELREKQISRQSKFDYLRITFSDQILFSSGAHRLNPAGQRVLDKLSPLLRGEQIARDIARIQVEGHTDDIPVTSRSAYPSDNWELSTARAISVVEYLSGLGVPSGLFSANGYNANVPVSQNRDQNRRIEIKVFFSAD